MRLPFTRFTERIAIGVTHKRGKMVKAYLEPIDIQKMEEAAEYQRDRLLIHLLFRLGCRVSEVLSIAVGDIDFARGIITIEHLKARVNFYCSNCGVRIRKTARFCPDCGAKVKQSVAREASHRRIRRLPVDSDTLKRIRDYIDAGGPVSQNGRQLLFGIGRTQAWKIVSECARKAGLGSLVFSESGIKHGVSPHRLRDSFAVHAVKRDGSADGIRVLQEHLGHQSIATTMRYRKIAGEEHREWFDRLWEEPEEVNHAGVGNSNNR